MAREFKVVCKGVEGAESTYNLFYGKGGNKLAGTIKREVNGVWIVTYSNGQEVGGFKTMKSGKESWGAWATANYRSANSTVPASDNDADSPNDGTAEVAASPATHDSPYDELVDRERAFFETLSKKRDKLTEWQRSQCKVILRRLCGLSDNPKLSLADLPDAWKKAVLAIGYGAGPKTLKKFAPAPVPFKSGPPKFKPRETTSEHVEDAIGPNYEADEPAADSQPEENGGESV